MTTPATTPKTSSASSKPSATHRLLARAHSPATAARIHADKIQHKPLLLRPTEPTTSSSENARSQRQRARAQKQQSRKSRKPAPLTAVEKRKLGVYDLPRGEVKYQLYEGLHRLWCGYMREVLGLTKTGGDGDAGGTHPYVSPAHAGPLVASVDFHGALLRVVRSKCVGRVGVEGIVVRDTRGTFVVVARGDEMKILPKEGTVFRVAVPLASEESSKGGNDIERASAKKELVFEVYGNQLMNRPAERANKKFKKRFDPDI